MFAEYSKLIIIKSSFYLKCTITRQKLNVRKSILEILIQLNFDQKSQSKSSHFINVKIEFTVIKTLKKCLRNIFRVENLSS